MNNTTPQTSDNQRSDLREMRANGMADARAEIYFWVQRQKAKPWNDYSELTGEEGYNAALEELEAHLEGLA